MTDDAVHSLVALPAGRQALLALALFALTFAVSLAAVVTVLVRLPSTYFLDGHAPPLAERRPIVRWLGRIAKNALGCVLVLIGLLLSLPGVPGQGVLTILIGVMLVDFPGKRKLERRLISRPRLLASINRLRACFGRPALRLD